MVYESLIGEQQKPAALLRKRSPSGTDHVQIADLSIFLFCSNELEQYLWLNEARTLEGTALLT